jgi:hypothetical protein
MPLTKTPPWPFAFQYQNLIQQLPPSELDPWMYPGSGPKIPGLPYPPPGWPASTWPIVPMSGWPIVPIPGRPHIYPSRAPQAQGMSRAMSALMDFLRGEDEDQEVSKATSNSQCGNCTGQCSKCRNG